jgi:hypothetical protein
MTGKQQVESLLHKLPDNCSLEDIQYHLYVLEKVQRGLDEARTSGMLSQEERKSGSVNGLPSSLVSTRAR